MNQNNTCANLNPEMWAKSWAKSSDVICFQLGTCKAVQLPDTCDVVTSILRVIPYCVTST